jgi:hypothetical protein
MTSLRILPRLSSMLFSAAVLACFASAALADVKNGRGPPVTKCAWVTETECSQETLHGPIVCHTRRVWDCEVVSGTGSMKQ